MFMRKLTSDECNTMDGRDLDIDQISMDSLKESSSSDDLYMSVSASPVPGAEDSDSDFLSLSSRHVDPLTDTLTSIDDHQSITSLESARMDSLPGPSCSGSAQLSSEDLELLGEEFISSLPTLNPFRSVSPVFGIAPCWSEEQKRIRHLREADLAISKSLEESNLGIYGSALAFHVIEKVRWLNYVSKDPELSRLVNEIDPKFPLAVRQSVCEDDNISRSNSSASFATSRLGMASVECKVPPCDGVDEIVLRRKADPTWHSTAASSISRAFSHDPVRDPRVSMWVQDLVQNFEKAISLPTTAVNSSEIMVSGHIVHLRGSSDWAPPRDAWIFTPPATENIKELLQLQKLKCAGCGTRLKKEYFKRVRFCEYYGKVFCHCCHQGAKSIIPGRILFGWNFGEYPVSDRAFRFLSDAKDQPAIHVSTVAPELVHKVAALRKVVAMREKLSHMWRYIDKCTIAEQTETKLKTMFTSLEYHLLLSEDIFSLSDLARIHNKDLISLLEPIVAFAKCHIESCDVCKQHAFVCSLCADATDLLFPFQTDKVVRCKDCGSLAHIKCHNKLKRKSLSRDCPKCARLKEHRDRQRLISIS